VENLKITMKTKICIKCHEEKNLKEYLFYPNGKLMNVCKRCRLNYQNKWKREQRIKRGLKGNAQKTHCPNGHLYIEENLRKRKRGRDCLICHRERELLRKRKLGIKEQNHPTKEEKLIQRRKWEGKRRAIKANAFVEDVNPLIVFQRDNGICQICSLSIGNKKWEIDHIISLSKGGKHSYANVQLAHASCNRKKWANE